MINLFTHNSQFNFKK